VKLTSDSDVTCSYNAMCPPKAALSDAAIMFFKTPSLNNCD